jgi:hypothetical protein
VRQPRVRQGSPSLDLPENVAIDLRTNATYTTFGSALPVNSATQNVEILFGPSGGVIGLGSGNDKIQLWLRDTSMDATTSPLNPNATFLGDQILVTVYVRSGFISANPVDTTMTTTAPPYQYVDPYAFTRDGKSSGL